jgi:hypothetical protein
MMINRPWDKYLDLFPRDVWVERRQVPDQADAVTIFHGCVVAVPASKVTGLTFVPNLAVGLILEAAQQIHMFLLVRSETVVTKPTPDLSFRFLRVIGCALPDENIEDHFIGALASPSFSRLFRHRYGSDCIKDHLRFCWIPPIENIRVSGADFLRHNALEN